jgi:hypothetical protein
LGVLRAFGFGSFLGSGGLGVWVAFGLRDPFGDFVTVVPFGDFTDFADVVVFATGDDINAVDF